MTDGIPLWIALLTGLGGGAFGAIIASFLAYKTATTTMTKQIEHQTREAMIARRVEARSRWLNPLAEAVARAMQAADEARASSVTYAVFEWQEGLANKAGKPSGTVLGTGDAKQAKKSVIDSLNRQGDANAAVMVARYQNTDSQLEAALNSLSRALGDLNIDRVMAMAGLIDAANSLDAQKQAQKQFDGIESEVRRWAIPFNKRVADLLEGAEVS